MAKKEGIEFDKTSLKVFSKLLNKSFKQKYEWFKNIDIIKLDYTESNGGYIGIMGDIYVDDDWGGEQWREYNYSRPIPDELDFGEIIGGDLSKEIQQEIITIFTAMTGLKIKWMSFSWVTVHLVDDEKLQEDIYRIKEVMGINEDDSHNQTAVIEITKSLGYMNPKYYYQSVPYWQTKKPLIYIKKGSAGHKTISTNNIKVLKVFSSEDKEGIENYLNKLRDNITEDNSKKYSVDEYFDPLYFIKNKIEKEPRRIKADENIKYEEAFQKLVNFIFKLTQKEIPLKRLKGFEVTKVTPQNQWVVVLCPIVDDWYNWRYNNEFLEKLKEFKLKFKEIANYTETPHSIEDFSNVVFYSIQNC